VPRGGTNRRSRGGGRRGRGPSQGRGLDFRRHRMLWPCSGFHGGGKGLSGLELLALEKLDQEGLIGSEAQEREIPQRLDQAPSRLLPVASPGDDLGEEGIVLGADPKTFL